MSPAAPFPRFALSVDGLACRRGGRAVFEGLDLMVGPGEAALLRGRNGAGKTTLLMCLAGVLRPAAGRIAWAGADAEARPGEALHLVGHRDAVKPALTLTENLEFWADMLGGARTAVVPALDAAGLGGLADYPAAALSAGQARRLALARLMVAPRPAWLLDEPTSSLDEEGARWVAGLIGDHLDRGGLVVAATHRDIALGDRAGVRTVTLGDAA